MEPLLWAHGQAVPHGRAKDWQPLNPGCRHSADEVIALVSSQSTTAVNKSLTQAFGGHSTPIQSGRALEKGGLRPAKLMKEGRKSKNTGALYCGLRRCRQGWEGPRGMRTQRRQMGQMKIGFYFPVGKTRTHGHHLFSVRDLRPHSRGKL